ncbi:hypothetical protein JHK87_017870 [Glycine soja]|nr:hypothetical protein JHK87_017870 [Glycine soja]
MTEEEFIRNNRAINAGKDLPREYLSELFQSISTCAFSLEQTTGSLDMNPSRWIQLINRSKVEQPFHNSVDVATTPESGVMSPTDDHKFGSQRVASMISWFSHLSSESMEDDLTLGSILRPIIWEFEALIALFSDGSCISGTNYAYCVVCAFGCFLARNSSVDKKKILDLLADSVKLLIHWHRNQYSDPGSNVSIASYTSNSSFKDNSRGSASANYNMNLFVKLGEAFRRTSLSRQEEIRNHAVSSLYKSFNLAEELHYMSSNRINYFNLVIFAMVDELHEKMLEYSRRENAERESRSTEETLKLAMELLSDMYLQSLRQITESPGFRTFWSGILRRKDTCMKADLGQYGPSTLGEIIPDLLRKIITQMKEEGILEPRYVGDYIYSDTVDICPHLKDDSSNCNLND